MARVDSREVAMARSACVCWHEQHVCATLGSARWRRRRQLAVRRYLSTYLFFTIRCWQWLSVSQRQQLQGWHPPSIVASCMPRALPGALLWVILCLGRWACFVPCRPNHNPNRCVVTWRVAHRACSVGPNRPYHLCHVGPTHYRSCCVVLWAIVGLPARGLARKSSVQVLHLVRTSMMEGEGNQNLLIVDACTCGTCFGPPMDRWDKVFPMSC